MDAVAKHYTRPDLVATILDALKEQSVDVTRLSPDDLAPIDEFHIRGREATIELAELAGVQTSWRVLDVGAGLGGSSRFLASKFGCHVTGVDLTPAYCEAAAELSRLAGLSDRTEFHCADALRTPFEDGRFDLAWTQHVQMNIADKPAFYREIARVLKPGGRFVFHDLLAGPGGPPHFPTHWAEQAELSFLIAPDALSFLLEETGFRILAWKDTTDVARDWYFAGIRKRRQDGAPPLGLHLLLGETAPTKFENVARNLQENRLRVYQGLLEKA